MKRYKRIVTPPGWDWTMEAHDEFPLDSHGRMPCLETIMVAGADSPTTEWTQRDWTNINTFWRAE